MEIYNPLINNRDMEKKDLIKLVKSYKCGKHKKLIKVIEEMCLCGCACHSKGIVNDCHYLNNNKCVTCGGVEDKKCNNEHCT